MSDRVYRFHDGEIQIQHWNGLWRHSHHDDAELYELPHYEKDNHPAAAALREKFAAASA